MLFYLFILYNNQFLSSIGSPFDALENTQNTVLHDLLYQRNLFLLLLLYCCRLTKPDKKHFNVHSVTDTCTCTCMLSVYISV